MQKKARIGKLTNNMTDVESFLSFFFRNKPQDVYVLIWTLTKDKKRKSHWFKDYNEAVQFIEKKNDKNKNFYIGCGYSPRDFGHRSRCKNEDIAGIVGLWADVDIAGEGHKEKNLPPDIEHAMELIYSTGFDPTMIIHSGHGLQVWWFFKEPWMFVSSPYQRQQASSLSEHWNYLLKEKADEKGWKVDSTFDLARILRIPGTWNCKAEPVMAKVLEFNENALYDPDSFKSQISFEML